MMHVYIRNITSLGEDCGLLRHLESVDIMTYSFYLRFSLVSNNSGSLVRLQSISGPCATDLFLMYTNGQLFYRRPT